MTDTCPNHRRRTGGVLARLLGLAVLLGVLTALAGPAQARIIGRGAEISIGRETASAIESYFVVDADPVAVARVRQIGRRLAASAADPDFPFEFHVVESPEVNAFALPGGFIYVFRGLLQLVPNDDALAFVLAHEVSHVTRHHSIKQFEKNLLLSAGISAILAGTGARGYGSAANVVQAVAGLSFTRRDEKDADDTGIHLLAKAGYNPRAAVDAMELVKRASGDGKSIPALLRSHPAPDSRIKMLRELGETLVANRAAARPEPRLLPSRLPLPEPVRVGGLEKITLAPTEWLPLAPGARWVYRLSGGGSESSLIVRALEPLQAEPAGIFRMEYELARDVRARRLIAPAGDRYWSRGETDDGGTWRLEALFGGEATGTLRPAGTEKVTVPAGQWEAAKVEHLGADGKVEATSWHVRGVGLVKRVSAATGVTQELTSYNIPRAPAPIAAVEPKAAAEPKK